ncbi:prolipoprotein diacylglyceryl transferase [Nonomuraea sp. K274]|uniref:Phosphatidylglycerol--prolipoprotein diacylglyceryl transferase n=1 Tax=Nonomuraea cypriaca TaxID=1187855 RepID=A0A931A9G3_9ACTN|nr:prolipoprotein diacylglyceryl transferase [Nonomuraea cypriaca]MBF8188731.1 prolipoprotein diacylglyceryl transferase [Nonomuraea cypriaca]
MPLASIPSPSQGVWYLGVIPIRAYALCIVLGVVVAVWLSERRWRARGGQKGTIIDIAVPAVIFGLIGGRLYHVITDWQTYFGDNRVKEPYQALFIWEGGLGIWGAVALGGVGVWLSVRKRGISMGAVADTVAPGIAFAQAIGRWGNWFNQELYGSPTTLPWGLEIDIDHGGEPGVLYHPTFLYESLWDVALGFVLIFAGRRFALHHGRLFAVYVAGYTLGRFWIEGLRIDPVGGVDHAVTLLGLRLNQWTSIVVFLGALVYLWAVRNKDSAEVVVPPSDLGAGPGADPADPAHSADQADTDSPDSAADSSDSSDSPDSSDDGSSSAASEDAVEATASDETSAAEASAAASEPKPDEGAGAEGDSTDTGRTETSDAQAASAETSDADAASAETSDADAVSKEKNTR